MPSGTQLQIIISLVGQELATLRVLQVGADLPTM